MAVQTQTVIYGNKHWWEITKGGATRLPRRHSAIILQSRVPRNPAASAVPLSSGAAGSVLGMFVLAGIFTRCRFHLTPELIVGNAARLFDLTAGLVEKRLELR